MNHKIIIVWLQMNLDNMEFDKNKDLISQKLEKSFGCEMDFSNQLAKKVSAQVLSSGRSRTLEPMNPYERRIIHTVIQEIEGVTSNSVGEGSGRRVVVSPEGGERGGRGGRGQGGRGGRGRGDRRPSQTVNVAPDANREPKKDSPDIPLYGRLN